MVKPDPVTPKTVNHPQFYQRWVVISHPQLQVDYWIYYDLPRMLLSLLLDLGLLQVTCYLPDGEATPWAIVEDECIWCIFWPFLRQSKLMSPSFLRLKTRWPRLRHRQHQQTSHWWPEENYHYLGDTGGTPIAVIIRVELVRGDTIWFYCLKVGEFFQLTRHCKKYVPHVWLHFLWMVWMVQDSWIWQVLTATSKENGRMIKW